MTETSKDSREMVEFMEKNNDWLKNLPNQLTLFRMGAVPVLLFLFPLNYDGLNIFCAALFTVAALTDWLDGYIARRYSLESRLGAIIDPIADKALTGAALLLLAANGALWAWMAGFLLVREMAISGLRLVAQEQGVAIPVNLLGKWKTLVLDVAIGCLMVNRPLFGIPFQQAGMVAIWLALFLSLYSFWIYFKSFLKQPPTSSSASSDEP